MLKMTATTAGLTSLEKVLKAQGARHKKALETALKVRGYKLTGLMKKEIRAGAPGGKRFAALSWLARRWGGSNRLRPDKPLSRLAIAVRYHVAKADPLAVSVGFTHPSLSKSWRTIAQRHQDGFEHTMADKRREYFAAKAANLPLRAQGRRQMFIRKSTSTFRTPPRPIIDPFWAAHKADTVAKIRRDFRAKLKGERI